MKESQIILCIYPFAIFLLLILYNYSPMKKYQKTFEFIIKLWILITVLTIASIIFEMII